MSIVLVLLVVILILALPVWPYSSAHGWGPSGFISLFLVVLLILVVLGYL